MAEPTPIPDPEPAPEPVANAIDDAVEQNLTSAEEGAAGAGVPDPGR